MTSVKGIAFSEVVSLADLTVLAFAARRTGYARALLHQDRGMRASVLRLQPRGCVPAHKHSSVHDIFIGIRGELEIRWERTSSLLGPGGFCSVPPGTRHEVRNRSEWQDAYCVLLHTRPGQFDFVETE